MQIFVKEKKIPEYITEYISSDCDREDFDEEKSNDESPDEKNCNE